ncbi:AlbA family DNA-binding domain-containing protein [Variovorax sp. GB1P17]|uniref:AlbA family DNA-binding domain-containing protein n=1 Tax=Variovorax sp. GB1P17 TaxID=3443740 RepID=UPI003F455D50
MEYADILRLIESVQSETDLLDYKRGEALGRQNDQRDGLMKEVLGFANSGGGTLIYGVATFADRARKHLPERLAPVTDPAVTVEWIQQMINSNSAPRFSDVQIQQLDCPDQDGRIFVLEIGQAQTAHQAPDGLYYQRAGLETLKMSDSQIRDVMNRRTGLRIETTLRRSNLNRSAGIHRYDLIATLNNIGHLTAERWRFRIDVPNAAVAQESMATRAGLYAQAAIQRVSVRVDGVDYLRMIYPAKAFARIAMEDLHPGDELVLSENTGMVFPVSVLIDEAVFNRVGRLPLYWRFSAADSSPIDGTVAAEDWCDF